MAMTPKEIADRTFAVERRGYSRQEVTTFLDTVAEDYRAVLTKSEEEGPTNDAPVNDWARLGQEVATVLQTAQEQVAALKRNAQDELAEQKRAVQTEIEIIKAEAEQYATELRRTTEAWAESGRAAVEADAGLEEARQTLAKARTEALGLMADTKTRSDRLVRTTEREAQTRVAQVLSQARAELSDLQQSQEQANQWLEAAHAYLTRAIDSYQTAPKPDLSEPPDTTAENGQGSTDAQAQGQINAEADHKQ